MENLYAFLIGLAFPVTTLIVGFLMVASGAKQGEPTKAMALLTLVGVIVWAVIFFSWSIGAGFIAFGGWTVGLAISLSLFQLIGMIRRKQLGYPGRQEERVDLSEESPPTPKRSSKRALAHIAEAKSSLLHFDSFSETDIRGKASALLDMADHSILGIESDWTCGDGYVLLAIAYQFLGGSAHSASETVSKGGPEYGLFKAIEKQCAALSISAILRWAKLKEHDSLLLTSQEAVSWAMKFWGEWLSKSNLDLLGKSDDLPHEGFAIDRQKVLDLRDQLDIPYFVSPLLPTKVRTVRLESTEGCSICPNNFPWPLDLRPFDFLSDEAAHTSEFDHALVWEGMVEVPDVFDIPNISQTCAVFIKGLLAAKNSTSRGFVYRFGIERPFMTDEQMQLLRATKQLERMEYRYFVGGPAGVAKEISGIIKRQDCRISEEEIRQVREGLSGFDLRIFNIALTTSNI